MKSYEHLPLKPFQGEVQRQTRGGGGGFKIPEGRVKKNYVNDIVQKTDTVVSSYNSIKTKYSGILNPSLIFEIEINQGVDFNSIEQIMSTMGIHILSSAENKQGFWVVFSDDEDLKKFKTKLSSYGSPEGPKYDFFNAFGELRDIPREEKIGERLNNKPLTDMPEFIDIELWRMTDEQRNQSFIDELTIAYPNRNEFRITDQIITKSFVLLRAKLSRSVFDEIIELKEIARADRPSMPVFNPFELKNIDLTEIERNAPDENATGVLIIDSGIISNHPLLEKCVGGEENYQNGEVATHDTVGHGTAVAGNAAYGDIEKCIEEKIFNPTNWIFSAKVMYAEANPIKGEVHAVYDPEKLVENQLKDVVESFLSNSDYHIRVVNISLGNAEEVWQKNYNRQLPLASIIDELAYLYPNIVFVVSTGNQHPINESSGFTSINDVRANYPKYLIASTDFGIVNPATSALALTVGSIAQPVRAQLLETFSGEQIKTSIAKENQPSPFTRTGPGINDMIKPELVEYGGNLILYNNHDSLSEDIGGKVLTLNNQTTSNLLKFDYGTSFSAPKIAHVAGQIANKYPQRTANFIKNILFIGAEHAFLPNDYFYCTIPKSIGKKSFEKKILAKLNREVDRKLITESFNEKEKAYHLKDNISLSIKDQIIDILKNINYKTDLAINDHINVCGFGLPSLERAINSFDNKVVLFDEGKLQLNKIKVFSLQLPDIFFDESGKKRIIVNLAFTPETRSTRGDSYLGNRMEFHLFHTINPQELVNKYGIVTEESEGQEISKDLKKFEIKLTPGVKTRKPGCHQKAWREFKRDPRNRPTSPLSLVLINYNKWMTDENAQTDYCLSVVFEHEKEIDLYNQIRAKNQARARIR